MTRFQEEFAVLDAVAATAGESGATVAEIVADASLRMDHEMSETAITCILATLQDDGLVRHVQHSNSERFWLTERGHGVAEREVHTP